LLDRIYEQAWFKAPEPEDQYERTIWSMRAALLDAFVYENGDPAQEAEQEIVRYKRLAAVASRPDQQKFSSEIRTLYKRQCAITKCNTPEALQAAHIRVLQNHDINSTQNGILLRSDIHALFDAFLITLSEDGTIVETSQALTDPTYKFLRNAKVFRPRAKAPSLKNIQNHRKRFFEREGSALHATKMVSQKSVGLIVKP